MRLNEVDERAPRFESQIGVYTELFVIVIVELH